LSAAASTRATLPGAALRIAIAVAAAAPALALRLSGAHTAPLPAIAINGLAVVAAAFLLAWGAEAAQRDISGNLAMALLALIAVLPEYAIDLYFAFSAGRSPEAAKYAAANMTGSNRLLLGLGWPFVLLLFYVGSRRRARQPAPGAAAPPVATEVVLGKSRRIELAALGVAGLWCLAIPFRHQIGLLDTLVLLLLFAAYLVRASREKHDDEPELIGVAQALGALPKLRRRTTLCALFVFAALAVFAAAQPFADGLVQGGRSLGLDEFLLVQWLAPLASEAPEFLVAAILALRGNGDAALGALLSSKVNQWTMLVGSLPLAQLAGGGSGALPLDHRQFGELLLTAAQALLGFAVLCDLRLRAWEALLLLSLFVSQLCFTGTTVRLYFSAAYLAAAALILVFKGRELRSLARAAFER